MPPEDEGQAPEGISPEEFKALQEQNQQLADKLESTTETVQALQSDRDKARAELNKVRRKKEQEVLQGGQGRGQGAAGGRRSQVDELRDFANDKAREAMVLREVMNAGITVDDLEVDADELQSPAEVKQAVRIAQLNRNLAAQGQQLDTLMETATDIQSHLSTLEGSGGEGSGGASSGGPDAGGPSGTAPAGGSSQSNFEEVDDLRSKAREIKEAAGANDDALKQARYLALRAAHSDPRNVIGRGRGGPTQAG